MLETAPVNSTILSVQVSGATGSVVYSITNLSPISDLFKISSNGEIKIKADLKTDNNDLYEFDVQATGEECTATARVSIAVRRNVNAPVIVPG